MIVVTYTASIYSETLAYLSLAPSTGLVTTAAAAQQNNQSAGTARETTAGANNAGDAEAMEERDGTARLASDAVSAAAIYALYGLFLYNP